MIANQSLNEDEDEHSVVIINQFLNEDEDAKATELDDNNITHADGGLNDRLETPESHREDERSEMPLVNDSTALPALKQQQ